MLEAIRANETLTAKQRAIHDRGLVTVLRQLHDELDAAVAAAYGWDAALADAVILDRLVALNRARADEESRGTVRYLRPAYQQPHVVPASAGSVAVQSDLGLPNSDLRPLTSLPLLSPGPTPSPTRSLSCAA